MVARSITPAPSQTMNIGFVSTRFAGSDGVSLEAAKWAGIMDELGHRVFWFSGQSDRPASISRVIPEAFFGHPKIERIDRAFWETDEVFPDLVARIEEMRDHLARELERFCRDFRIELMVVENALAIPMHLSLGLAITDWIERSGMPTIAHHHDFLWERERFLRPPAEEWLRRAFPPRLPSIAHAVIQSEARDELKRKTGSDAVVIPNVMDFEHAPVTASPERLDALRGGLGFAPEDRIFLQPTRVVPRKGIEHAIDLLAARNDRRDKLVISHAAGDEGFEYLEALRARAGDKGVDLRELGDRVDVSVASPGPSDGRIDESNATLWDVYAIADFITYPSLYEGFGNALLESFACRRPVLVNRYPVYRRDIEPLGFRVAEMDGAIDDDVLARVDRLLADPDYRREAVEHNFRLARENFGFDVLRTKLPGLIESCCRSVRPDDT